MTMSIRSIGLLLIALVPMAAHAGPREEAVAVVERWSAAYTSNDAEAVVSLYTADAILLGTVSPIISEGTEAIRTYFSRLKGSGNKNTLGETRTIVLGEEAVLITGFYEFTSMQDGKLLPRPSRFTMLVTKHAGEWRIAHHHSSPRVQPTT